MRVIPYLCLLLLLPACTAMSPTAPAGDTPEARTLMVFAAASLTESFTELGARFEAQHPGTTVTFNFAASNQLAQQIGQGAPADLFASANQTQMDAVVGMGRISESDVHPFVRNELVVITPADNPGGIDSLQALANPGLKIVFAAEAVPVGQYSLEFLAQSAADSAFSPDYQARVLANVVSYEANVRAVLSKVALGEADAGIVYTSDVGGAHGAQVAQIPIPEALNVVALYPIAPIFDSAQPDLAADFIEYVRSDEGQAILAQYGFLPVAVE